MEASWIREVMLAADDMVDRFLAEIKARPISEGQCTYGSTSGLASHALSSSPTSGGGILLLAA